MAASKAKKTPPPELAPHTFDWLAPALTLTILPHWNNLPIWLTAMFFAAVSWRWWAARRGWNPPRKWLLSFMTLAVGAGILVDYGTLMGRDAGVALLVAMSSLKLVETRSLRDGMVLVFLGYFLVMANLLYTQSLPMAAYLLLAVTLLIASQMVIQQPRPASSPLIPLRFAGRVLLQSLPVMLILFILFPRIPGPLWGLPRDAYSGFTGLSDEMSPGDISQLNMSDEVAFRVRFQSPIPPSDQLYWRGPVLWRFDGRTWRGFDELPRRWRYDGRTWHSLDKYPRRTAPYDPIGSPIEYSVILEPHGQRWLFALDLPAAFPPDAGITDSLSLVRPRKVNEVLSYDMRSYPRYRALKMPAWAKWRRWIRRNNPRTRALANEWRARYPEPADRVNAALRMFQEESFYYTLNPPTLGRESIDEFLFDTRRGYCEHYAGSFVFLMQAAEVPARVVTGYQGGERNALGNYFIVRQSDAHAWAEVWLPERGWIRVDPTAAVAPQRVEQGLYAAIADPTDLPFMARRDNPLIRQLALSWDSINNVWNEWVLSYGPERQREFLSDLGLGINSWREMTFAMVTALACLTLAFVGYFSLQRRRNHDPVARSYRRFCAKLARSGLPRASHEGALAFAERIARKRPDLARKVQLISRLYVLLRYGPYRTEDATRRLQHLVKAFKT